MFTAEGINAEYIRRKKMAELTVPPAFDFLNQPKRYKAMYGGRGAAKSHSVARVLLLKGMRSTLRIVCAREIQKSIKDSVHKLLSDIIRDNKLDDFYQVLETEIRGKNGTEFIFRGLKHNTRDLKSLEGADICWIEEAENVSDGSYEILIPTIRKDGSEIWATFNVKNTSDPSYRRFITEADDDTIAKKVSWRDNPHFPTVLMKEMEKLKGSDPDAYNHIWEGAPDVRRSGAVYAKQIAQARSQGRITKVPYDPSSQVFTAWDLGFGDSTSIWWLQFVGRELRWIDFYENNGEQLLHYVGIVKGKNYNYAMQGHFLPHDGASDNIVGASASRQLTQMGLANRVLDRENDISPGIDLVRQTLEFSCFDSDKCAEGLRALENYSYEWDEDKSVFSKRPKHDWTSHASDAARYAVRAANIIKAGLGNRKPSSGPLTLSRHSAI
jgi:phage terminase large subunit